MYLKSQKYKCILEKKIEKKRQSGREKKSDGQRGNNVEEGVLGAEGEREQ